MFKNPSHLSVLEVADPEALRTSLVGFAAALGFERGAGLVVLDQAVGGPEFISVDNVPAGYRELYADRDTFGFDPVMQHCKRSHLPIVWDQSTYVKAGQGDAWDAQARFGYRCGMAIPLHLPDGRHFVYGVTRDQALPRAPDEITHLLAQAQLFAVHAQDAAMRLLAPRPAGFDAAAPSLTRRELEALRWTKEGKTAWELGRILGIAEQTAVKHIHHASRKLGCGTKHQAVLKALRLKLIS